jgi:hypothetical protein
MDAEPADMDGRLYIFVGFFFVFFLFLPKNSLDSSFKKKKERHSGRQTAFVFAIFPDSL